MVSGCRHFIDAGAPLPGISRVEIPMASVRGLRRWLAPAGVVIVLGGCVALFWLSGRALDEPFVAPGAEDVAITQSSLDTRQISYQMPGPDDAWQSTVARRLSNSGWRLSYVFNNSGTTE